MSPRPPAARPSQPIVHRPVVPVSVGVPGRARLRVDGLRGRPAMKFHLEDQLLGHAAVHHAKANPVTGTLLVLFDFRSITVPDLIATIARCRKSAPAGNGHDNGTRIHLVTAPDRPAWHTLTREGARAQLETSAEAGLSSEEAEARLAEIGPNRLPVPEPKSPLAILRDQVAT